MHLVLYVSGHGFGHATRMRALCAALRAADPTLGLHVRTEAPHWIFHERDPTLPCSSAPLDVGILQPNGLDLDLPRTLEAHLRFGEAWEEHVAREAAFLRSEGASLVVCDIPPLAFAAAQRVGLPAVGVANFSWDWILDEYAEDDARWSAVVARYRDAYAHAQTLYRLPLHGDFGAFRRVEDVPLLVTRSALSREAARARLGVGPEEERPLVLLSFGGFGGAPVTPEATDELSDFLFVGFGPAPSGLEACWRELPRPSPIPHEDLMRACDAIIGKPGYSTVAEAVAHDTRFLFVTRDRFREVGPLEAGLARYTRSRCIPRADFEAARWGPHLRALFAAPAPAAGLATDGAETLARLLLRA